mgnify:CR=1 FL=1
MDIEIENHPLEPFLPANARLLMLGSFPPQKKRWSMDFYYPNLNNDMWRIVGLLFFNNKDYFLNETRKAFCRERIISFLNDKGIALFDTASAIRRLQDNASDKFLEVVQPTDISRLLGQLPECKAIVTTGQKATDTLRAQFEVEEPKVSISLSSSLMDARCAYTACLLLHEPIRWHSTKKRQHTASCIRIYKCSI